MTKPLPDDLLGYLLGALDASQQRRIEEELAGNPELRQQLEQLRQCLEPLRDFEEDVDPPPGLAERTCVHVQEQGNWDVELSPRSRAELRGAAAGTRAELRMPDLLVAAGVCLTAAFLFFPAIAQSRFRAQRTACADNLRQIGAALADYSDQQPNRSLPFIPLTGNRAFAGLFAPLLLENGFLNDPNRLICPSSPPTYRRDRWRVPRLVEFDSQSGAKLRLLQEMAGGSYGYNMGVRDQGQYRAPRDQRRPYFAIAADAPSLHMAGRQSANHAGRGQNVLFEDGRVVFLVEFQIEHGDDLFRNREGFAEAGVDLQDAVIGNSSSPPIRYVNGGP